VNPTTAPTPEFDMEILSLAELRPHPRNYREHTEDQIIHIIESLKEHGYYRNVVVARENTILAGHGVVKAALRMAWTRIPGIRLDVGPDDPAALKVLTGDNEIARLAEVDDRLLTELLKEIKDDELSDLLGTGYDPQMLAALAFVTRPASEITDFDEAAEWAGMPEFDSHVDPTRVIISFQSEEDRDAFVKQYDFAYTGRGKVYTAWWPPRPRRDLDSVRFEEEEEVVAS
jgi:hypothetical protein